LSSVSTVFMKINSNSMSSSTSNLVVKGSLNFYTGTFFLTAKGM